MELDLEYGHCAAAYRGDQVPTQGTGCNGWDKQIVYAFIIVDIYHRDNRYAICIS
jgi:hypothetical protein